MGLNKTICLSLLSCKCSSNTDPLLDMICKHILQFCVLSFHSLDSVF